MDGLATAPATSRSLGGKRAEAAAVVVLQNMKTMKALSLDSEGIGGPEAVAELRTMKPPVSGTHALERLMGFHPVSGSPPAVSAMRFPTGWRRVDHRK